MYKVVYFTESLEDSSYSFCRDTDTTIFDIKFHEIFFLPIAEMNFSFWGEFGSITKQVTYNLYDTIPVSGYIKLGVYIVQNQFSTVFDFITELLFQLQADIY